MPRQRSSEHSTQWGRALKRAVRIFSILCCPPCPHCIINKVAFHPPTPPTYTVVSYSEHRTTIGGQVNQRMRLRENVDREIPELFVFLSIGLFPCRERRIAVMIWALTVPSDFLILHSHVNGADLGGLYDYMSYLREKTKCDIVSYDYCGYGASSGTPTENNIRKAADAVLQYIVNTLNRPLDKIILYGQSIGTVPTVYLASLYDVAGVILHSGLFSGLRILFDNKQSRAPCPSCDPFRNVDYISRISAPVLFIHGAKDQVIPISHAEDLFRMCRTAVQPLWMEDVGHMGLETKREFLKRVRGFIEFLRTQENCASL